MNFNLRQSCRLASQIRAFAGNLVRPGVTTDWIDKMVHEEIIRNGAYPSPLAYPSCYSKFPKSIATSVNDVVVHGIPDLRPLEDGDIINIDITVYLNGFHGDCSATFLCGNVDQAGRDLVSRTREAMMKAIAICKPNVPYSSIGQIIGALSKSYGYGTVENYCGHGIGRDFHSCPYIYHFPNHVSGVMIPNVTFTIEPMLNEGSAENQCLDDGWTIVTRDGSRSAQFEETIVITETGAEILTKH